MKSILCVSQILYLINEKLLTSVCVIVKKIILTSCKSTTKTGDGNSAKLCDWNIECGTHMMDKPCGARRKGSRALDSCFGLVGLH